MVVDRVWWVGVNNNMKECFRGEVYELPTVIFRNVDAVGECSHGALVPAVAEYVSDGGEHDVGREGEVGEPCSALDEAMGDAEDRGLGAAGDDQVITNVDDILTGVM